MPFGVVVGKGIQVGDGRFDFLDGDGSVLSEIDAIRLSAYLEEIFPVLVCLVDAIFRKIVCPLFGLVQAMKSCPLLHRGEIEDAVVQMSFSSEDIDDVVDGKLENICHNLYFIAKVYLRKMLFFNMPSFLSRRRRLSALPSFFNSCKAFCASLFLLP